VLTDVLSRPAAITLLFWLIAGEAVSKKQDSKHRNLRTRRIRGHSRLLMDQIPVFETVSGAKCWLLWMEGNDHFFDWKNLAGGVSSALKSSGYDLNEPETPATTFPWGKAAWQAYLLIYAATVLRSSEKVDCRTSVVSSFGVPSITLATILSTSLYVLRP